MKTANRWRRLGLVLALGAATLVIGTRPVARAWERWERARWHAKVLTAYAALDQSDSMPAIDPPGKEQPGDGDRDDPTVRRLFTTAYFGKMTPDVSEQLLSAARAEAARWPSLIRSRAPLPQAAVAGQSWVNLGPTDARIQSNGGVYDAVDSGRAATIRVDPRSRDIVYVATAFGGVWKTFDFTAKQPTWHPITDTIGGLAVGAFELDPNSPDTLYLGLGDALDSSVAGGAVYKSTDGGGSWTMLTARLSGTYPASAGGRTESAVTIRDLAVDRADGNRLLVATDVGLFRSVDGGASFSLVPLPDKLGTKTLELATWTIAYLGAAAGQSVWVVSGMDACQTNLGPPGFGDGQPAGATCTGGTVGDIWRSSDSGDTWTSLRATAKLPTAAALGTDFGRMALAAGPTTNPDTTVVYAQVANIDDGNSQQIAIFKSIDGGKSFTAPAGARGTHAVTNPSSDKGCIDMNVGHDQSWYNLALAVDPSDANHVLVGGNLCGVRSLDGGTTWSNVSHWLPPSVNNTLPYVHADWHAVTIANVGGVTTAFTGSDGGLFSSTDVFTAATGGASTWNFTNNRGIATHLFYGIATGDPTAGDDNVVFGGLQDNGTRFRDLDATLGKPTTFNQIIGGDGFGTAVVRGPAGIGTVFWGSIYSARFICTTTALTCSQDENSWATPSVTTASTADPDPFTMRYSVVEDDPTGAFITPTTYHIWKIFYDPKSANKLTATKITPATPAGTPGPFGTTATPVTVRNVAASPFQQAHCAGNLPCRLYGAALSGGNIAVGTDIAGKVTWSLATAKLGTGAAPAQSMSSTTSVAFPSSAAHFLAGAVDGKVYIATSTAPRLNDLQTVVPDAIGRIFLTTDGGASYTPFHGNGTADLPNVPTQVVVFDPSDTTDQTIFVGNDLGVYQTTDMGKSWHRYGVGLPLVRVTEIRIAKNSGLMRIGTYGRGLWEIYPNATAAAGVRGDGDWDRNLAIDFLDLGALASRLGDTPATTAQPYYDWHLDVVGSAANSIAEDDLTALVAKFGSNP